MSNSPEPFSRGFEACVRGNPPACESACPFSLDMRPFMEKLQKGNATAAMRQYAAAVVFPRIVSSLCPAPCRAVCDRARSGGAIDMPLLERSLVAAAGETRPRPFNLPAKNKRVLVVGASLSSLACACRLAALKYEVTLVSSDSRPARELEGLLDERDYLPELERTLAENGVKTLYGAEASPEQIEAADAAVVPADYPWPDAPAIVRCERCGDPVDGIVKGLAAFRRAEWYLSSGSAFAEGGEEPVKPVKSSRSPAPEPPTAPASAGALYTADELKREAARCLLCDCSACADVCEMLRSFKVYPRELASQVESALLPDNPLAKKDAMRPVFSCNLCGKCASVCPEGVDLSGYLALSRRQLERQQSVPSAFHEFWLRDMEHADGEGSLVLDESSEYVFFPGCQLAASDPRYVSDALKLLREKLGRVSLLLRCCGIPADWAGKSELFEQKRAEIYAQLLSLGKPRVITACPSCHKSLEEAFSDIEFISVYEALAGGEGDKCAPAQSEAAVFDPCAARDDPEMRAAVRLALKNTLIEPRELPESEAFGCCSRGGNIYSANSALAQEIARDRAAISELPYITYCTNCRDVLASQGKAVRHVLDALLGINEGERRPPGISERRANRLEAKALLGGGKPDRAAEGLRLVISDELKREMSERLILEEDVIKVIEAAERTGEKFLNEARGSSIACERIGTVTFWAEYLPPDGDGAVELIDVYSHRMRIEG